MGATSVSVYRKYQPQWWSPCELGDPCEICRAHLRGKKRNTDCLRAVPATPAFSVPIKTAIALVKDGLACFIHRNTAVQLTFSNVTHLRDRSLKIDEAFLIAYATGKKWARDLFDNAWDGKACVGVTLIAREQLPESGQLRESWKQLPEVTIAKD